MGACRRLAKGQFYLALLLSYKQRVMANIQIIGAGLAGSEAALFLAGRGHSVTISEMRPVVMTEAHHTGGAAELVCSNSFKSQSPISGPGMLKAEMELLGSSLLPFAKIAQVPGGEALAVDRDKFSELVTQALKNHPLIKWAPAEITEPAAVTDSDVVTLIATGPLTSPGLTEWIERATEATDLYFYDAIAPIVDTNSIDMENAFIANRYDKGEEAAYLNCPMDEAEYNAFLDALIAGEKVPPKNFEKEILFQGCQPIESIAATGRDTLRFGPMKPVGLTDPRTGKRSHAVVQLRPENRSRTAYNIVGFQTKLKYGEQAKIFRLIPALKNAEFLRMGSIHRNTYVNGPRALRSDLSLKKFPRVYLAGQITGVEGYLESAACGLMAASFIAQRLEKKPHSAPPANTALGALLRHVVAGDANHYQPANVHFGLFEQSLFDGLATLKKDDLRKAMASQALSNFEAWARESGQIRSEAQFQL